MKKQYTVILYSYFGKARVRQNFSGVLRQVASLRLSETIKSSLCARVRRPQNQPEAGIDEPRRIQYADSPVPQ